MRHRFTAARLLLALVAVAAAGCRASADPRDMDAPEPAPETLSDDWFVVKIDGMKAGYSRETRQRRREGSRAFIETTKLVRLTVVRDAKRFVSLRRTVEVETEEGTPVSFEWRKSASSVESVHRATVEGGRVALRSTIGGVEETKTLDWEADALSSEGARRLLVAKLGERGTRFTTKSFSETDGRFGTSETEVVGPETIEHRGEQVAVTRLREVSRDLTHAFRLVDGTGTALVTEADYGGMVIRFESAPEQEAVASPELIFRNWTRADAPLPRPRSITSLTVRVRRPEGGLDNWKVPTSTQEILARDDRSVTLRVRRVVPAKPATLPIAAPDDLLPLLEPQPFVQSNDPAIKAKAAELRGSETDSLAVARILARFVDEHIDRAETTPDAGTGYASAKEVFERRTGDCTEHAVLLVALLRAAGIPAQLAGGALGTESGAFVRHAWACAWVGAWVDLDATTGHDVADAARLKLEVEQTDDEDAPGLVGKHTIEILEVVHAGEACAVKPMVLRGSTFEVPSLGVSFSIDRAKGWKFEPLADCPRRAIALAKDAAGGSIEVSYFGVSEELASKRLVPLYQQIVGTAFEAEEEKVAGHEAFAAGAADPYLFAVRLSRDEVLLFTLRGETSRKGLVKVRESLRILPATLR